MKSIQLYLSILISIFLFASCQKDIEFNGEITEPLIVVNSFLTPDSVVSAHISESRFFLKDSIAFKNILNADVAVWVNGVFKEKMTPLQDGSYKGSYLPNVGDIIKLIVNVPSKNEASSEAQIFPRPVISLDTTNINTGVHYMVNSYGSSTNNGPYVEVNDTIGLSYGHTIIYKLKFTDNANEKNYYRLVVQSKSQYMYIDTLKNDTTYQSINNYDFYFSDVVSGNNNNTNNDPLSLLSGNYSSYNQYNVFSDELINGKEYPLTFSTNENIYEYKSDYKTGLPNPYKKEISIYLQSISRDYYLYLKSRAAGSGGTDFFSEPIQIHSNIIGGIGILGSYTSSLVYKLDL